MARSKDYCFQKVLASAYNKMFSVENKRKLLESKVDILEKVEVWLHEEKAKTGLCNGGE